MNFHAAADGRVVTNAAHVVMARRRRDEAPSPAKDVGDRVAVSIVRHLHVPEAGVESWGRDVVVDPGAIDLAALRGGLMPAGAADQIERAANLFRDERPRLRVGGVETTWDAAAGEIGGDALVWAALLSASRSAPLTIGPGLAILASRLDAHPLSRARRAHAAAQLRLATVEVSPECRRADDEPRAALAAGRDGLPRGSALVDVGPRGREPSDLRVALLVASRALHDAQRTARTRPALVAVDDLAAAMLRHVEDAPVTRTDLPALAEGRSIVQECLGAAGVAAPVPY